MSHWVHDYETLINMFGAVFQHYKTGETKQFVVHRLRNDIVELIKFLNQNKDNKEWHISYNGLNFDSQITEYILRNQETMVNSDALQIANDLYLFAQSVIEKTNNNEFPPYSAKELSIEQIDVFRLNHWDNPAKRSSLKWIQYSMDWYNIQEMPIHHSTFINTMSQINEVMTYCVNDVESCKQIMILSKSQINLRQTLTKQYGINLYSASEPRIAKELFLHFLSKKTGIKKYELKQLRTVRDKITVKDIILPYINFQRPEFKDILEKFNELVLDPNNTKGGFKYSVNHKGVRTDFGLGGLHGARSSGVYEAKEGMMIMTSDVTSYYPNLAIRNGWSPAHLPKKEFCDQYEWFFDERVKIPKKDPNNYVYKIILNSTYGLSNDENSFLYDPEFTMRITINGQLSLAMLYEMLSLGIPGSIPLMQNTDGLEMIIPTNMKDTYLNICKQWEDMTKLQLEHGEYSKIILGDVNNYIAVNKEKEVKKEDFSQLQSEFPHYIYRQEGDKCFYSATKCKGRFEFSELALHKNKSFIIISKAVYHYFVFGTLPEMYLAQNRNIFEYCGGIKAKGDWQFVEDCIVKGILKTRKLQHIVRYYMSTDGCKITKRNKVDGRNFQVEAGAWKQTVFNIAEKKPWSDYRINEDYYLQNIYKMIESIQKKRESNQLTMF
jgi:hypothetical protein